MPHPVMDVLQSGIPLTLLMDLQCQGGPNSELICLLERPRADAGEARQAYAGCQELGSAALDDCGRLTAHTSTTHD
jgi:hypothetical protein